MDIIDRDKKYIWHPFTPLVNAPDPIALVRGEGTCLFDQDGKSYIDGIASWWVNIHGHAHPYLAKKIGEQVLHFEHALFSGFTHEPAVQLAERLLKLLPSSLGKVFYSDNGATSVEVSLKMAFQYWSNLGRPRTRVVAFENAYHGDTFGGMSVGARNAFNLPFAKLLFDVIHIPVPVKGNEAASLQKMKTALDCGEVAAFIAEPLVQGAAGMIMYAPDQLDILMRECKNAGVPVILDEVMTGFGRTGKLFASDYLKEQPDIVCLSKGITGGVMPLGVTVCSDQIHAAYLSDDKMKTFFHGHSYTANPTACSAALASLDLFEQEETMKKVADIAERHAEFLHRIKGHAMIRDIRQTGSILAIEIETPERTHYLNDLADKIAAFFVGRGIILRPLGNVVYVLPPYCITRNELMQIYTALEDFLNELKK